MAVDRAPGVEWDAAAPVATHLDSLMTIEPSLAESRAMGMAIGGERYLAETAHATEVVKQYCANLSVEQRREASEQIGCFTLAVHRPPA